MFRRKHDPPPQCAAEKAQIGYIVGMDSKQLIVRCPKDFNVLKCLNSAASVELAMAFAKPSGWGLVKEALLGGDKTIKIVVGLNFGINRSKVA